MMRLVKLVPAAEKIPPVMPAPKISSFAPVVVTVPLFADVLLPEAEAPTSNGLTGSRPPYSSARMSTYGVAPLNVTVTVFAPAADALMLLAYQMAWLSPLAAAFGTANRYALPAESTTDVIVEVVLF